MKCILFYAAVSALFSFSVCAQPVLTGSTNNPVSGDTFYLHHSSVAGVSIPAETTATLWNYSSLNNTSSDTFYFSDCATAPDCSTYPGSNIAGNQLGYFNYNYYMANASVYSALAWFAFGTTSGVDTYSILKYPLTYNDHFTDTFMYVTFGDTSTTINRTVVSGYGTLVLPSGIYHNVLLLHTYSDRTMKTASMPPTVTALQRHTYDWYTPGLHYNLLHIAADTFGTGVINPKLAYYCNDPLNPVGVSNIANGTKRLQVYPDPYIDGALNIAYSEAIPDDADLLIADMTGRLVFRSRCKEIRRNYNQLSFTIPPVGSGIYTICLQTADGSHFAKLMIK